MSGMKKNFALSIFIFGLIMATHASAYEGTLTKFDVKVGTGKEPDTSPIITTKSGRVGGLSY